jgi:hypothetical protein
MNYEIKYATDRHGFETRGDLFEVCIEVRVFGIWGQSLPIPPKYLEWNKDRNILRAQANNIRICILQILPYLRRRESSQERESSGRGYRNSDLAGRCEAVGFFMALDVDFA